MLLKNRPFSLCVLLLILMQSTFGDRVEMKINLGGEAVDGFVAEQEVLDIEDSMPKMRYRGEIKGNGNDLNVFKTQRFSRGEDFVLNVPVPDGVYTVTLLFAETWNGAYASGKRVFDVYMGSKPNGIVKVCPEMDPFRSGGPAGPVRRKFSGVVTQGGLTVALRPIKQNPQIAGIVIDGYSYSNALLEDLPTVPGAPGDQPDFSVLTRITSQPPADPSLLYDPSLNPKFKVEFRNSNNGGSRNGAASYAQSQPASASQSTSGTGPSSTYGFGGRSSTLFSSAPATSAVQVPSYGYPAVGTGSQPAGGNSARSAPLTRQMTSPFGGAPMQVPIGARGQQPVSPHSALNVRPTTYQRRRLASFQQEGTHADPGMISQYENLKSRAVQEQMALNSEQGLADHSAGVQTTQGQGNDFQSPSASHNVQYAPSASNAFDNSEATSVFPSTSNRASYGTPENTKMAAGNSGAGAYHDQQSSQVYNPTQVSSNDNIAQRVYQAQSETLQMNASPMEGSVGDERTSQQSNGIESSPTTTLRSGQVWATKSPTSLDTTSKDTSSIHDGNPSNYGSLSPNQQYASSSMALSRNNFPYNSGVNSESLNAEHPHTLGNMMVNPTQPMAIDQKDIIPDGSSDNPTSSSIGRSTSVRGTLLGSNSNSAADQTSSGMAVRDSPSSPYSQAYGMTNTALKPDQLNQMPPGAESSASNQAHTVQEQTNPNSMGLQFDKAAYPVGKPYSNQGSNEEPILNRPPNAEAVGRTLGDFSSVAMSEQFNTGSIPGTESFSRSQFASPNMDTTQTGTFNSRLEGTDGLRIVSRTGIELPADRPRVGGMVSGMRRDSADEAREDGNGVRSQRQLVPDIPGLPPVPGLPDIPGMRSGEEGRDGAEQREKPSVGVHNGMSGLDGMCINNSTHCSCGMAERAQMPPEECLFVVNEHTTPMICAKRACSGRLVCACAVGANTLCRRSYVKSILVPTQVHRHDAVEESNVVFCRREMIEEGVPVLSPII